MHESPLSYDFMYLSLSLSVLISAVCLFVYLFLAKLCAMWDLSFSTRDQTPKPRLGSTEP